MAPVWGPHKVQFNDWSNEIEREINSDSFGHDFWVWLKFFFSIFRSPLLQLSSLTRENMNECDMTLWPLVTAPGCPPCPQEAKWHQMAEATYSRHPAASPQSVSPSNCRAACPTAVQRCFVEGQRVAQMWRSMRKRTSPRRKGDSSVLPLLFSSAQRILFVGLAGYPVFVV